RITPGTCRIAATAASAAARAAACDSPRIRKLPPATPFVVPKTSSHRNSPSIVGTRQYRRPSRNLLTCQPSPKNRRLPPTRIVLPGSPVSPLKQAVVAQVSTHCATRLTTAFASASRLNAKKSRLTPGRPSGVSSGDSSRSIPASASQPITEAAYPVAPSPAVLAQPGVSAVTSTRAAAIGNASANVSSISTELTASKARSPAGEVGTSIPSTPPPQLVKWVVPTGRRRDGIAVHPDPRPHQQ